ncbi:hypothetical protein GCQ56_03820 [Marinifilum sp. N1E240]|uniref:hypothetical protein n=1 Tax=Marinifilum sp. N1E240 TaxID=2608082 RepID=UPI00128BE927|nr:hypothetical protein [Marinifilum sp. N1E240]MPQ46129.1 hypothetical protein [Marinifilum sp. N1E240]
MNDIRNKIWYFLVDSKTNEILSSLIVVKYQKWDLYTNIFLVVTTSSSVAAWTIWNVYPTLWALIIGLSQVITLIKPYFLFPKYIKVFNEKSIRWQHLSLELEEIWFELNQALIDEKALSSKFFELKKKSLTFDNVPEDIIFFSHDKLQTIAEKKSEISLTKI